MIAQLYNGINNLSEDYILEQYKVSFNINFSDTTGNVTLNGHDFDDIIQGGVGDDILRGGAGDDTIRGMGGADTFWGGDGDDRLVVREAGASVHGDAGMDKLFLQGGDSFVFTDDTLQNVEIIHLGAGSELDLSAVTAGVTIIQTSKIGFPGTIVGTQDADTIVAGGGYVSIRGGDGDDVLKGTTGLPSFAGEGGNDVITLGMRAATQPAAQAMTYLSEAPRHRAHCTAIPATIASRPARVERRSGAARMPTSCSPIRERTCSSSPPVLAATTSMASMSRTIASLWPSRVWSPAISCSVR